MRSLAAVLLLFVLGACASNPPAPPPAATDVSQPAEDTFAAFDEPPVLDKWIEPIYPEYAKQHNVEGLVQLRITVTKHGGVEDVQVIESSDRMFNDSAIAAAKQWRFKPARKDGQKVRSVVVVPVKFRP